MVLNEFGKIAYNEWNKLPNRYKSIELDIFQIMPNHIHGILFVGATLAVAQNDAVAPTHAIARNTRAGAEKRAGASPAPTMTKIDT